MHEDLNVLEDDRGPAAWAKLVAGAFLLTFFVILLMQGYTPPGPIGDVFRKNRSCPTSSSSVCGPHALCEWWPAFSLF